MHNEIGKVYGELKVISFYGRNKYREDIWLCNCSCGVSNKQVRGGNLRKRTTSSCGCKNRERSRLNGKHFRIHGNWEHPLYATWKSMHERCYDKSNISYKYYGAKGITISQEWHDFIIFIKDMGDRPSLTHTIDRKDNSLGYCKLNCRWATKKEQANNRAPAVRGARSVHTKTMNSSSSFTE